MNQDKKINEKLLSEKEALREVGALLSELTKGNKTIDPFLLGRLYEMLSKELINPTETNNSE